MDVLPTSCHLKNSSKEIKINVAETGRKLTRLVIKTFILTVNVILPLLCVSSVRKTYLTYIPTSNFIKLE